MRDHGTKMSPLSSVARHARHQPRPTAPKIMGRLAAVLALGLSPLSACDCETDLDVVAPSLYVDACSGSSREYEGVYLGGFEDCAVDFGPSDISVRKTISVLLSNPTLIKLGGPTSPGDPTEKPLEIFLTENTDPSFRIETAPSYVEAGLIQVPLQISYRPTLEATQGGTLVIRSDADNVPDGQDVLVTLSGQGVDNGIPNINVSPSECDFGRVAAGSVKECVITIENTGSRALVFDEMDFLTEFNGVTYPVVPAGSAQEAFGFFGRPPAADDVLSAPPEVNVITVALRFTPDVLGSFAGRLAVRTNDPDQPEIVIPLNGISVDPPTCDSAVLSVNGFPVSGMPTIEPLDDVIITAEGSTPSTASGAITAVEWQIIDKPVGSTAVLTNPGGMNTGFTFADVLGIDLAGRYRVRASVVDDLGTQSVNECDIEFEAIPTDSVLVQLSWDTSTGDMDLHLTQKNASGQFCPSGVDSPSGGVSTDCDSDPDPDCYYGNCKATSSSRPDWDNDNVNGSEGDPSLDIDDLSGFGPENINIDTAVAGEYLVGVDYFSFSGGTVGNTLRIYLYGQLQAEFFRELSPQDFWEVAVIHWPSACVEDLSSAAVECE